MEKEDIRAWLKKHMKTLASFDKNKNRHIEKDEFESALETVERWVSLTGGEDREWTLFQSEKVRTGLTWAEITEECASFPMSFVGRSGDGLWLSFAVLWRAAGVDLPSDYEDDIPVRIFTSPIPPAEGLEAIDVVAAESFSAAKGISDVLGSYSDISSDKLGPFHIEMAKSRRICEQRLRKAALKAGGTEVYGLIKNVTVARNGLILSLTGTVCRRKSG